MYWFYITDMMKILKPFTGIVKTNIIVKILKRYGKIFKNGYKIFQELKDIKINIL